MCNCDIHHFPMSLDLKVRYLFDLSRHYPQREFDKFSSDTKIVLETYDEQNQTKPH